MAIPWPDKIMHSIALYVQGNDEHGRMIRRTLMRYLNLSLILVLRSISSAVKRRFPTLEHLVEAGFMTTIELEMYTAVPSVEFNTYWIPCTWFIHLLKETRKGSRITDPQGLKLIMEEFNEYRSKCGLLWSYDWVSLPLVYTQVRPVISIRLMNEVAEQLINPFGDDDEDFELNWIIDRHTKVSYLGVDILMAHSPPLVKDKYFDDVDLILPYTEASVAYKKKTYRGSVHDMELSSPPVTQPFSRFFNLPVLSINRAVLKPLSRSESAPGRKPSLTLTQWPSSSTLCKSDSFRLSETSIDVDGSQQGINTSPQLKRSTLAYEKPAKHHSFSGGDFTHLKPTSASVSNFIDPKRSPSRSRALLGKIKSLPKLMPINRNSSFSSMGNAKPKKGVRWKPMVDSASSKCLDPEGLELEKMYSRGLNRFRAPRLNSLETPDIKFTSLDFPSLRLKNPDEAIYCDLCRRRVQRISASPNPETMSIDTTTEIKHCSSAPALRMYDVDRPCTRERSYSWQNKICDKMKSGSKRNGSIPYNELQIKEEEVDSAFFSQSAPCLSLWESYLQPAKPPNLEDNGLRPSPLPSTSKEKTTGNFPPPDSPSAEFPSIKTLHVPNPELEMDASSPPTSRKNSDMVEGSQDGVSWKSADWSTLLSDPKRS
ncbi:hypothetical protein C0J52_03772 [Blattella germanica]|nr:hypothetical protein C0J52_03772 [Blattella germanica]